MDTTTSGRESATGWCDTRDKHDGRNDHPRSPNCRNFVSDAEHTAQLIEEAREHDRKARFRYPNGATNPAAAYVVEHRPY